MIPQLCQRELLVSGKEKAIQVLHAMLITRFVDEKMSKLVRQNQGGTFFLSVMGHEMVGAVSALSLLPGTDWGLPYYRDRAFAIGLGCSPRDLFASFLGREGPHHSGGRMMPEHFSQKSLRIPCQSSCVGSQFLHAVGIAKGVSILDRDEVVYVSAGDGATSQGDFHEALNLAALHALGVVFVIQDNGWAISVPTHEQTAGSIAEIAAGYRGLFVHDVDGCDYEQLSRALTASVSRAREGHGPSVIVAKVPRIGAHSNSDDQTKYKCQVAMGEDRLRDPLPRFETWLLEMGLLTTEELARCKETLRRQVEEAAQEALAMPFPDASSETAGVFKGWAPPPQSEPSNEHAESIVMVDALNHALDEEMQRDPHVLVFGEDVAHDKGGVFGVTRRLTAKHGASRCFNTPLAESSLIGTALGLSLVAPIKPVVEIQFADYVWPGINQLFNELASFYYRSNAEWHCPVVVRLPYGGYIQGGPYHSQSIEAFLAHCPGLKIVVPSNAADAKRLLKTAIRDPNPVLFFEHKALYRQRVFCARPEPDSEALLPFGQAQVVQEGRDLTVLCWGMMVSMAVEAAKRLDGDGILVEIIDLRTLVPLDMQTLLTSVRKTGKVLIVHEAPRTCGFGAELAARIGEEAFSFLDAPILRVAGEDCPVPYSKPLEEAVLPQLHDLEEGMRRLAAF